MLNRDYGKAAALALALTLGLSGLALAEDAAPETFAAALARADAEGKLLIVDFFTDW